MSNLYFRWSNLYFRWSNLYFRWWSCQIYIAMMKRRKLVVLDRSKKNYCRRKCGETKYHADALHAYFKKSKFA
jgi:hypothetical protein